jgi:hypothetical protein
LSRAGTMVWFKTIVMSASIIAPAIHLYSRCGLFYYIPIAARFRSNCRHAVPFTATDGRSPGRPSDQEVLVWLTQQGHGSDQESGKESTHPAKYHRVYSAAHLCPRVKLSCMPPYISNTLISAPAPTVRAAVSTGPVCAPGLRLAAADPLRACAESPAGPPAAWRYLPPPAPHRPRVGL